MEPRRVLVFPGGTEIGLEINKALRYSKEIKLYSTGSNVSNPAPFFYKNHFELPTIHEDGWIAKLNDIIQQNNIDFIFPAYDDVIVALAENQSKIRAQIISSDLRTCLITRSKLKTYLTFQEKIPIPQIYHNLDDIKEFPVFIKPDKGEGSHNVHKVDNLKMLKNLIFKRDDYIVLEYLPGKEFTIDCFSDRDNGLLFCEGRERVRIRSGISVNTHIVKNETFIEIANIILNELNLYGAWFFQLKEDKYGVLKLMEIAPRIAGSMSLNRVRGINLPLLSIYEKMRIDVNILLNDLDIILDRAFQNRYKTSIDYNYVYVDLDDTLIFQDKVNFELIKLLYQCINNNKKIILLTKHMKNVADTLKRYKISSDLFFKIIKIDKNESKSNFINHTNAIFIDDSFTERLDVAKNIKIPTFDCSMIECLFNDLH